MSPARVLGCHDGNLFRNLSGDEPIAALRWLVARGTIRVAHINDALKRREQLVADSGWSSSEARG